MQKGFNKFTELPMFKNILDAKTSDPKEMMQIMQNASEVLNIISSLKQEGVGGEMTEFGKFMELLTRA